MDLEGIVLSEISQTEKGKYHVISVESKDQYKWINRKEIDSENRLMVDREKKSEGMKKYNW